MKCDRCKEKRAVIFLDHIIDNTKKRLCLCLDCAVSFGIISKDYKLALLTPQQIESIFKSVFEGPVCSVCGMKYSEFIKKLKAGCENCWDVFYKHIGFINKSVQSYTGIRRPKSKKNSKNTQTDISLKIAVLKKKLVHLVETENYEEAIAVRDTLQKLESHAFEKF